MKKQLSVFGLFARSSIYKILSVLFLFAFAETTAFIFKYKNELSGSNVDRFESYINLSNTDLFFAAAFILITIILCLPGTEYRSKVGYTLNRLSVTEKTVYFEQSLFNFIVYIMLWAVQILTIFLLSLYYNNTAPSGIAIEQTAFLAFYRNDFLHSLLPLQDLPLWIRNIFLIIALSLAVAEFPYKQRRKKVSITALAVGTYIILFFSCSIGDYSNCIISIVMSLIVIALLIRDVLHKEDSYDN